MRIIIYSHDTFGLGNIRRTLAICKHLNCELPGVTTLIVSGSPMLHSFRVGEGIDYIKLPCLKRSADGSLDVRYLRNLDRDDLIAIRCEILLSIVEGFCPDLLIVDKKPGGLAGELESSLTYLKTARPETKLIPLLRDILDSGPKTIQAWKEQDCYGLVEQYYESILVLGEREIFDVSEEYRFPFSLQQKVRYCGYIARESGLRSRDEVRNSLAIPDSRKLIVVTTGGGEDGFMLLRDYLAGLDRVTLQGRPHSLLVTGPELCADKRAAIAEMAERRRDVSTLEFTDDMMSYIRAADLVVSMGGYNTICEILSLVKRAIVVPRVRPVQEQLIRAERMASRNLFQMIHPDELTPECLMREVNAQLAEHDLSPEAPASVDMHALPRITSYIQALGNEMATGSLVGAAND